MIFKRLISIILVIMTLLSIITLTSCSPKDDPNAEIQLWYYDYGNSYRKDYDVDVNVLVSSIETFCITNNIPLKIIKYGSGTLAYEDYELKRNLAAANGNMIIIEDPRRIWDISKDSADYTKLENYDNLLDEYKNRFCIPIGVCHIVQNIQGDILNYYDIKVNKPFLTYNDYLDIKQEMKEKGAKFDMNKYEYPERCDYYLIKNGLRLVNNNSKILNNRNNFKAALKSSILETINDINKYNNNVLDYDKANLFNIKDNASGLFIYDYTRSSGVLTSYYTLPYVFKDYDGNVPFISPNTNRAYSPCFYMNKKITNSRIYEVANYIISENSYKTISRMLAPGYHLYSPVFKGEITREVLELNENFEYNGYFKISAINAPENDKEKYIKICNYIDSIYEILIKNDEDSKIIADYFYANEDYVNKIKNFVEENVRYFTENNIDYKNEEENKKLDNRIDEFISNFNIHFK